MVWFILMLTFVIAIAVLTFVNWSESTGVKLGIIFLTASTTLIAANINWKENWDATSKEVSRHLEDKDKKPADPLSPPSSAAAAPVTAKPTAAAPTFELKAKKLTITTNPFPKGMDHVKIEFDDKDGVHKLVWLYPSDTKVYEFPEGGVTNVELQLQDAEGKIFSGIARIAKVDP